MKKNNKKLLNEELNRFKFLNEYSFYVPEGDNPDGEVDDLLLSEEDPEDESEKTPEDDLSSELGVDAADGEQPEDEVGDDFPEDNAEDLDDESAEEFPEEPMDDTDSEITVDEPEEEVELDVTELVDATDEAKESAEEANSKVNQLMQMVSKLDTQLNDFQSISKKIQDLETEIEKRVPTPEEKLEMRSLDSYPYNLKLTDFWADKKGNYDAMGLEDTEGEPNEYTLTKDDIDSDYSESNIKATLDDDNPYEEEDLF